MKATDKITNRVHAICPVLRGYQVCLIPDTEWDKAKADDISVLSEAEFNSRFTINEEAQQ